MGEYSKTQQQWVQKSDDRIEGALAELKDWTKKDREAIMAEAARRGLLQNVQVVKMLDLDIPFGSMVRLAFKWFAASLVAALPFALALFVVTCTVHANKESAGRRYGY